MNHIQVGFIKEAILANPFAWIAKKVGATGMAEKLMKSKFYASPEKKRRFYEALTRNFSPQRKWKNMEPWEKARISAGIAGNIAIAAPAITVPYYLGKKLINKKNIVENEQTINPTI